MTPYMAQSAAGTQRPLLHLRTGGLWIAANQRYRLYLDSV
jgi:hypothetical protein